MNSLATPVPESMRVQRTQRGLFWREKKEKTKKEICVAKIKTLKRTRKKADSLLS